MKKLTLAEKRTQWEIQKNKIYGEVFAELERSQQCSLRVRYLGLIQLTKHFRQAYWDMYAAIYAVAHAEILHLKTRSKKILRDLYAYLAAQRR